MWDTSEDQPLTVAQVDEAIEQMMAHCRLMEEQENYEPISARGTLRALGYFGAMCDQVLKDIGARGFNYCLDPIVLSTPGEGDAFSPTFTACYWGPDQLGSRLGCLSSRR